MKNVLNFLQNFFRNQGQYVFISLFLGKICAFLGAWLVIHLLPETDYGKMNVVASVFALFASASGLGSSQSLIRYGAILETPEEKQKLSGYLFWKGIAYQLFLALVFIILSVFYIPTFVNIFYIFIFFAVRLLGFYIQNHIQSYLRIFGNNRSFARVNNAYNVMGVLFILIFTYYFKLYGYLFAVSVAPFISLFWLSREMFRPSHLPTFSVREIWDYALKTCGTSLLSDALFTLDIVILGFLLNENAVAHYKVALLIPANVTFLAIVFMQTDFPQIAKNYRQKQFLVDYVRNYFKIFFPISIFIFLVGSFFSKEILQLFFPVKYNSNQWVFCVLLGGFCWNMFTRNLFGNMLSAVGKMSANTWVSILSLFILFGLAWVLVPRYHELGMGISLVGSMFISGCILAYFFYRYLLELK